MVAQEVRTEEASPALYYTAQLLYYWYHTLRGRATARQTMQEGSKLPKVQWMTGCFYGGCFHPSLNGQGFFCPGAAAFKHRKGNQ